MTWISIILYLLAHAPEIVAIVQNIISLIGGLPKGQRDGAALSLKEKLVAAIEQHKLDKNNGHLAQACSGVACMPELKSI